MAQCRIISIASEPFLSSIGSSVKASHFSKPSAKKGPGVYYDLFKTGRRLDDDLPL